MSTVDHNKVKELLATGDMSYTQIGDMLGCSREYIRQLDWRLFNRTGRDRSSEKRMARMVPPDNAFTREAVARGLRVEPVINFLGVSSRMVVVNGRKCLLLKATKRADKKHCYYSFRASLVGADADFHVYDTGRGFLILLPDKVPRAQTMISIDKKLRPGGYALRHDYMDYFNKWEQFNENS